MSSESPRLSQQTSVCAVCGHTREKHTMSEGFCAVGTGRWTPTASPVPPLTSVCPDCGVEMGTKHTRGCRRSVHNYRKRIRPWKRERVYKRDNYRCVKCGSTENLSIDHIVSVTQGGTNRLENLQTMCRDCNREKA